MKSFFVLILPLSLFACEKAELPKPINEKINTSGVVSVSMGGNYENVLYYNLESRTVIRTINRTSWDLGFGTDASGTIIQMNGAKLMSVSITSATNLAAVTSNSGAVWLHDSPTSMSDSLALKNWEVGRVYLLDRGINASGSQIGKIKFRISSHDADSYTVEWAKVSATSGFNSATIQKNASKNIVCFSFEGTGATVNVEPAKNDWDLCFGSYTYIYPDGMPYLVNGVICNRNIVRAVELSKAFSDISLSDATSANYTEALDVIGFDWKTYNFDASIYVTDHNRNFVVKAVDGNYYKLRFLDFYDAGGVKGAPSFELVKL